MNGPEMADLCVCVMQALCRNAENPCQCGECSSPCPVDNNPGACAGDSFYVPDELVRTEEQIRRRLNREFLWFTKEFRKLPPCLVPFSGGAKELLNFVKENEDFLHGVFRLRTHFHKLPLPEKNGKVEWEKYDFLHASQSHAERTCIEELLEKWKGEK